jgi:hypothetical protein
MALWLSLGILTVIDGDAVPRYGLLPSHWFLVTFLMIAIGAAAVFRISARTALPLFLTVSIVLPWLPLPMPDVLLVWTGPMVRLVWGAVLLCMIARLAHTISGNRNPSLFNDARKAPAVAAAIAFAVFVAVRFGQTGLPTGDEPHYLVIAESLVQDGDLKVVDNYVRADYLRYYGGLLEPHFAAPAASGRTVYSVHAPGLPAIVAPAFLLGGYWAVVVWVALLVALGTAFVWKAAYVFTGDPGAAWFGWASVALTAPVVLHGTLIYPDPVAGMLLAGGIVALALVSVHSGRTSATGQRGSRAPLPWSVAVSCCLGAAAAALPRLHTRLALPAAIISLLLLLRITLPWSGNTGRLRHAAAFLLPFSIGLGGWLASIWIQYGTFNPAASYGDDIPLDLWRVPINLLALIADQEFGIVPSAPVHLLWLAGFWFVFKRDVRLGIELLLIVGPYALASSGYSMWWAGASPPARFLVPIVFPIGLAMGTLWAEQGQRGRTISLILLGTSVLIAEALAFGGDGTLAYSSATGRARWLDWLSPLVDLPLGFPSYFRDGVPGVPQSGAVVKELATPSLLWGVALVLGWSVWQRIAPRLPDPLPVRTLVAMGCLSVVVSLGVQATWSFSGGTRVLPTRAQLELLRGEQLHLHTLGVQLPNLRFLSPESLRGRLALTTSDLESPPPGSLLYLEEIPPGEYTLQVRRKQFASGELLLRIGVGSFPVERWTLSDEQIETASFHLPVYAQTLVVSGDDEAQRSVHSVALVPVRRIQASNQDTRARDAGRYGSVVVYVTDDRVWLEPTGFWVRAEQFAEVVVAADDRSSERIDLEVRNVPVPNRIRLTAGRWSMERELAPDERWPVRIPIAGRGPAVVSLQTEKGFEQDGRLLGCFVAPAPPTRPSSESHPTRGASGPGLK